MAEVQQCETENPGQNLPDLTRTAHRVYIRFMWPAAAVGSHSASTPSLLWYKFRHSGHFVMHGPVYYLKGTQIVNKYLNIIITISWHKKNTTSIILTLEIRLFSKSSELYQGYIIKILCILIYSLYKIFGVFIIVLVYLFSCTICLLSCVSLRGICGVWKTYPSKMLMFSAKKSWSPYRKKQISFI